MENLKVETNFLAKMTANLNTKNHIFLETKHFCFLCLQKNSASDLEQVSLKNVCKVLNVNTGSKQFTNLCLKFNKCQEDSGAVQRQKCDFAVSLCTRCASITENLSSLVFELYALQLKILHNVQLLRDVAAIKNGSQLEQLKLAGSNQQQEAGLELANKLRDEIKQNCVLKIVSSPQPKVHLNAAFNASQNEDFALTEFNNSLANFAHHPTPKLLNVAILNLCKRLESSTVSKRFSTYCPLCRDNVGSAKTHFICNHPHLFFLVDKLSSTSETQFKKYCQQALQNLFKSHRKHQVAEKSGKTFWCNLCCKPISYSLSPNYHVLMAHSQTVRLHIRNLQQAEKSSDEFCQLSKVPLKIKSGEKTVTMRFRVGTVNNGVSGQVLKPSKNLISKYFKRVTLKGLTRKAHQCALCRKLVHGGKTRDHMVSNHLKDFFLHKKLSSMTDDQFTIACRKVINNETKTSVELSNSNMVKCLHCQNTYKNANQNKYKTSLQYHLLVDHHSILETRLVQWLNGQKIEYIASTSKKQSNFKCDVITMLKNRSYMYEIPLEILVLCKVENSGYQCPVCKASLNNYQEFRLHLRTLHPQLMFANVKLAQLGECQFKRICNGVIQAELQQQNSVGFKCQHCKLSFKNKRCLIAHLLKLHYNVLKEKVVKAQEVAVSQLNIANKFSAIMTKLPIKLKKNEFSRLIQNSLSGNKLKCQAKECQNKYPIRVNNSENLSLFKFHTVNKHPDLIFKSVKKPTTGDKVFGLVCKKVFESEFGDCKASALCKYCKQVFTKPHHLKYHAATRHYELLKQKIIKEQETFRGAKSKEKIVKRKVKMRRTDKNLEISRVENQVEIKIEPEEAEVHSVVLESVDITDINMEKCGDEVPVVEQKVNLELYESENRVLSNDFQATREPARKKRRNEPSEMESEKKDTPNGTLPITSNENTNISQNKSKPVIPDFDLD